MSSNLEELTKYHLVNWTMLVKLLVEKGVLDESDLDKFELMRPAVMAELDQLWQGEKEKYLEENPEMKYLDDLFGGFMG